MIEIPSPLRRVCVVMMSAVGDAVHVLPVINALKRQFPSVHVSWILQPGPASLVQGHPSVDEILLFEREKGWHAFTEIRRELSARRFDLVLALQVYFKAGLVTALTTAPVKLGFDRARARDGNWLFTTHRIASHTPQHVQDQYFEFGLQPILVGAQTPRELAAERLITERARHPVVSTLGSGLRRLVGILDESALVLAPDTGPLHMAVALEKPVISLMGYTNPKRTGPYRRYHDLIVDAYGEPGENYPVSMQNRRDRMPRIAVRDVLDRVERWRTAYQGAATAPNS